MEPYVYNAVVESVWDGDTIHASLDLGMGIWDRGTDSTKTGILVRLNGCNAIELDQPGGVEARDHLASLLPSGTRVLLRSVAVDKFGGRVDADIQLADGTDLVAVLVAGQWAAAWDGTGPRPVPPWPRTLSEGDS